MSFPRKRESCTVAILDCRVGRMSFIKLHIEGVSIEIEPDNDNGGFYELYRL